MLTDTHNLIKQHFDISRENVSIPELNLRINFAPFSSEIVDGNSENELLYEVRKSLHINDDQIDENKHFVYPVFMPYDRLMSEKAIILLHGLNERKWDKYYTWAHYLANHTGKAVILFPISFHLNRGKHEWTDPHEMSQLVEERKKKYPNVELSTFANFALSERLTESPERFFLSGIQTIYDLQHLIHHIQSGDHPLFDKNTHIDFFAYSIGGLLAQVMMIADKEELLSDSKFFFFCAGSAFGDMNGTSKVIMDSKANERTNYYYTRELEEAIEKKGVLADFFKGTSFGQAFRSMISLDRLSNLRDNAFKRFRDRISGIALQNDKVIPADKIINAFTKNGQIPKKAIEVLDFPFSYTHEMPFPFRIESAASQIEDAFQKVFRTASVYLA